MEYDNEVPFIGAIGALGLVLPLPTRKIHPASQPQGYTLRRQMLTTILPTVLSALAIAVTVNGWVIYQGLVQQSKLQMEAQAFDVIELIRGEVKSATMLLSSLASNPLVINAVQAGTQTAEAKGLPKLPIQVLETRFASTKLLQVNPVLNNYLRQTAKIGNFAELFFSESNGFNIATSHFTSDFVQRDEIWWQQGKKFGNWLSNPNFDQSSNTFSIDLIKAIQEPKTGRFLGVIKAVFSTNNFSKIRNNLSDFSKITDSQIIQIIDLRQRRIVSTITSKSKEFNEAQSIQVEPTVLQKSVELIEQANAAKKSKKIAQTSFLYNGRQYLIVPIPEMNWVVITSVDFWEIIKPGLELLAFEVLFLLVIGGAIAFLIFRLSNTIYTPLTNLSKLSEKISTGNLEVYIQPDGTTGTTETTHLAESFNNMVTRLKKLLQEKEASQTQAMQLLLQVQAMAHSIQSVATNSQEAEINVKQVSQKVKSGDELMNLTVATIAVLQEAVTQTALKIEHQGEALRNIDRVVSLIDELAMQTNILSFNAAIEANHAGVAGQGFAVVAKEIRNLSRQSASAASEIKQIVQAIQTETRQVCKAMEAGKKQAIVGTRLVSQTKQQLSQIKEMIVQINQLVNEIAQASTVQAETSASISNAIHEVMSSDDNNSHANQKNVRISR